MKHILCFGDSNTFGYNAEAADMRECRFGPDERWTGVLQQALGAGYRVIEEGLGGRTTVFDEPASPGRSGLAWLLPCLQSHQPLDLVIFMLGTNDTKPLYHAPAAEIAHGMDRLLHTALDAGNYDRQVAPAVLLASPIHIDAKICSTAMAGIFDEASVQCSRQLAPLYRALAESRSCAFIDAAQLAGPGADGVHLNAGGHAALGRAFAAEAERLLAE